VLKLFSLSPATFKHWANIGSAQFTKLALPAWERELAILLTTAKFGSTYEYTHHIPISAKFGITDQQRDELARAGAGKNYFAASGETRNTACFSPRETAMLRFVEAVIEGPEIQQALWEETRAAFSDREIVELITLQVGGMGGPLREDRRLTRSDRASTTRFLG
jgi:alkylhydroperoxidase family enzyme